MKFLNCLATKSAETLNLAGVDRAPRDKLTVATFVAALTSRVSKMNAWVDSPPNINILLASIWIPAVGCA